MSQETSPKPLPVGSASIFNRQPFELDEAKKFIGAQLPSPPPLIGEDLASYAGRPDEAYRDYEQDYLDMLEIDTLEALEHETKQQKQRFAKELAFNVDAAYQAETVDIAPQKDDRHRLSWTQRGGALLLFTIGVLLLMSSLATYGYAFYNHSGGGLIIGALLGFPLVVGGVAGKVLLSSIKCKRTARYIMGILCIGTLAVVLCFAALSGFVYGGSSGFSGGSSDSVEAIMDQYTFGDSDDAGDDDSEAEADSDAATTDGNGTAWWMVFLFMVSVAAEFMGSVVCFGGGNTILKNGTGETCHVDPLKQFRFEQAMQHGDRDAERGTSCGKIRSEIKRRKRAAAKYARHPRNLIINEDAKHAAKIAEATANKPTANDFTAALECVARNQVHQTADVQQSLFESQDKKAG